MKILNLIKSDRNKPKVVHAEIVMYATHPFLAAILSLLVFLIFEQKLSIIDLVFFWQCLSIFFGIVHSFFVFKNKVMISHFNGGRFHRGNWPQFYEGKKAIYLARKNLKTYISILIVSVMVYTFLKVISLY